MTSWVIYSLKITPTLQEGDVHGRVTPLVLAVRVVATVHEQLRHVLPALIVTPKSLK